MGNLEHMCLPRLAASSSSFPSLSSPQKPQPNRATSHFIARRLLHRLNQPKTFLALWKREIHRSQAEIKVSGAFLDFF